MSTISWKFNNDAAYPQSEFFQMNAKQVSKDQPKRLADKEFAKRLDQACDLHGGIPPFNKGRQAWIKDRLGISAESARKYFAGEARPRPNKMKKLAEILRADEAWLSLGIHPSKSLDEKRVRNAATSGAVNLVAGLIQLGGGAPAFPNETDPRAAHADLLAIIKGDAYDILVVLGEPSPDGLRFQINGTYDKATVLGVVMNGPTTFDLLAMPTKLIAKHGKKRGGYVDVAVSKARAKYHSGDSEWPKLDSLDRALIF